MPELSGRKTIEHISAVIAEGKDASAYRVMMILRFQQMLNAAALPDECAFNSDVADWRERHSENKKAAWL